MTTQHNAMQVVMETYRYLCINLEVGQTAQSQRKADRASVQTVYMMDAGDWTAGQTHCKDGRPIIQALFPDPREVPICSNQHLGTSCWLTIIKVHCHTICILLIACYLYV